MKLKFERSPYKHLLADERVASWIGEAERGSLSAAGGHFRRLGNICEMTGKTPHDLAQMNAKEAGEFLRQLVEKLEKERGDIAKVTVKSYIKTAKSWWAFNDIEVTKKIKLREGVSRYENERVPTREELQRILDVADVRQKVAISFMAFCGFRPEVMGDFLGGDGLRVGDFHEMTVDNQAKKVEFKKVPSLIRVRKMLSKSRSSYAVFVPDQLCEYLKNYLELRMAAGEVLSPDSPTVAGIWQYDPSKPRIIRTADISEAIRMAIRNAGFDWRPYVFRRYFDVRMMEAEADGVIIRDWRQYWMGHVGDIEAVYTVNKGLPESTHEKMRAAYLKASEKYLVTTRKSGGSEVDIKQAFKQEILRQIAGYSQEDVDKLDLSSMKDEEFQKMVREKLLGAMANNGNKQRVVPVSEVRDLIPKGWEYVAQLPDGSAVMRLPF